MQNTKFIHYDKNAEGLVIGAFLFIFAVRRYGIMFQIIQLLQNRTNARRIIGFTLGIFRHVASFEYGWEFVASIGHGENIHVFSKRIPSKYYSKYSQREKMTPLQQAAMRNKN